MRITDIKMNGMANPVGYKFTDPRVSWKVRDTQAKRQTDVRIEISYDQEFADIFYVKEGQNLSSLGELLEIELKPYTRYYVRVQVENELGEKEVSQPAYFETAKMEQPWVGKWITTKEKDTFHPVFYKAFQLAEKVRSVRLYISGLGLFKAELNGKAVTQEVLTPYYSNYHEEVQYLTFDITDFIRAENKLSVTLGNGWYKGKFGLAGMKENFGSRFQMIGEIRIVFEDGSIQTISTDETWSYTGSDIELSDIYDGEILNRLLWEERKNQEKQAVLTEAEGKLTERYSLPLLEMEDMEVKEIISTPAGETVLDFGQNFAGYPVFYSCQPRGTKITLDFGEILQDGNFYNENYRSAKSQFIYISDGREEMVKPSFTYFGFRYVRVTGWTGKLSKEDFTGKAVYSCMDITGKIKTGHQGVNQLFSNAMWGQKSNSVDFPTDCPQRDERLGWTGDAQVFCGTASYNMDTAEHERGNR